MTLPIKLNISADSLKEEVKCDFLVSNKLKKIQVIQVDLLNELLRVCRKHDIKLTVFAGTMLGAIRHKGFIPWDDDIDVAMTRENFERLQSIAETEFEHPYFFQTAKRDRRFFCAFARLRNSETTGLLTFNNSADYNNGIFIDIFVMDGISDNIWKQLIQRAALTVIGRLLNSYYKKDSDHCADIYSIPLKTKISVKLSKVIARIFPYSFLIWSYDKFLAMYNKSAKRFGLITHGSKNMNKYWTTMDELNEIVELPFENIQVPVSKNYDVVLRRLYGDYMKFPPINERGVWHQNIVIWEPDTPYIQFLQKRNAEQTIK
jgi:lipopolysaccharide cholinephosphotransferase